MPLHVKDLPEHGLKLISPSDTSFDALSNALLRGRAGASAEALKPFSVFLKNNGKKSVIAYSVKWELTRPDGRVAAKTMNYVTPWAFTGQTKPAARGHIIAPNSARFVSLVIDSEAGNRELSFDGDDNLTGVSLFKETNQLRQAQRERAQASQLEILNADLARSKGLKVSLDGAFFDDGTFVGPDTTGFFAKVKALRDARHDLLRQIADSVNRGQAGDALLREVEALTAGPKIRLGPNSTPTDYYNYHKRCYAAEFLRKGKASGEAWAIEHSRQTLRNGWPSLRKL